MAKNEGALTSDYPAPKNAKKIQKGDKGFKMVKKAFIKAFEDFNPEEDLSEGERGDTGSYPPPQSRIAIQPGDTGFKTIGKGYNRFLWTFSDWKNKKKKIIDPDKNWGLASKPMSQSEWNKKKKDLYL